MKSTVKTNYTERAKVLKALAHPVRLCMVDALSRRDYCVRELAAMVGLDMSTVSKHLSVLKNAGILVDDKRGLQVFYALKCACITRLFDCAEEVLKTTRK